MSEIQQKIKLRELEIVDENDQVRIRLAVKANSPTIELLDQNGKVAGQIDVSVDGYPKLEFSSVADQLLNVKLELDPKGSHLKFDHQQGASSYLFLNNQGISGLVMVDVKQQRKFAATVNEQGELNFEPEYLNQSAK